MSVRLKLALTIFATGLLTALLVIATVVYSFQRFENQTAYRRGMGFLSRVVGMGDDPERMDAGAVIVAKPVRRADAGGGSVEAGYLYLVLHTQQLPEGRWDALR